MSLNVKKVTNFARTLENKPEITMSEFVFLYAIYLVRIWIDKLPKCNRIISKSFVGTVLTTILGTNMLSKNSSIHLWTRHTGRCFYTKYFSVYQLHDGIWQNQSINRNNEILMTLLNQFDMFQVQSFWSW